MASRPVAVVLATREIGAVVVLELLFQWKSVELAAKCELAVDLILTDVEVLHVEEALRAGLGLKMFVTVVARGTNTHPHVARHGPAA